MSKLFYETQRSRIQNPRSLVSPEGESMTVPGETRTVAEMLRRHIQGIREDEREVTYFDQEDLDMIDHYFAPGLDLTDLDELKARNQAMADSLERAERAKRAAQLEADEDAKAEARLKAKAERERKQGAVPTDNPKPGDEPVGD